MCSDKRQENSKKRKYSSGYFFNITDTMTQPPSYLIPPNRNDHKTVPQKDNRHHPETIKASGEKTGFTGNHDGKQGKIKDYIFRVQDSRHEPNEKLATDIFNPQE